MPLSSPRGVPLRCCAIQTGAYRLVGRKRNLLAGVGPLPPDLMPSNLLGRYPNRIIFTFQISSPSTEVEFLVDQQGEYEFQNPHQKVVFHLIFVIIIH
ncbi:hypothetical protein CEXT_307761 [Caerostris extrusa]|uniref:Galectin n=1 Tax=Caerostris extrusa TaxID=172846 RepID=A0AAV4UA21_CAEEX|nr:hypothetical protein CEXT_307761 [Caerostris extrusa]